MSGMLAKVINSTVGTSTFKSLDEVLTGDKSIVASDEVYQSFPNELKSISLSSGSTYDLFTFTFPVDGSCNIHYKVGWSSSTQTGDLTLEAYKNNVLVFSNETDESSANAVATNLYIIGNKGDTFTIKLNAPNPSASVKSLSLYLYSINATVVDSKTMNIVSLR